MFKHTALATLTGLLVAAAGTGLSGCNKDKHADSSASAAHADSVWNRLGGQAGVRKVVDDFVERAGRDDKNVNFFRKGIPGVKPWAPSPAEVETLKVRLVELISTGTGGPLGYHGEKMKDSHKGMKITTAQFNALAGHLDAALKAAKVKDADRQAVMDFAASTRKDIVEVP